MEKRLISVGRMLNVVHIVNCVLISIAALYVGITVFIFAVLFSFTICCNQNNINLMPYVIADSNLKIIEKEIEEKLTPYKEQIKIDNKTLEDSNQMAMLTIYHKIRSKLHEYSLTILLFFILLNVVILAVRKLKHYFSKSPKFDLISNSKFTCVNEEIIELAKGLKVRIGTSTSISNREFVISESLYSSLSCNNDENCSFNESNMKELKFAYFHEEYHLKVKDNLVNEFSKITYKIYLPIIVASINFCLVLMIFVLHDIMLMLCIILILFTNINLVRFRKSKIFSFELLADLYASLMTGFIKSSFVDDKNHPSTDDREYFMKTKKSNVFANLFNYEITVISIAFFVLVYMENYLFNSNQWEKIIISCSAVLNISVLYFASYNYKENKVDTLFSSTVSLIIFSIIFITFIVI